MAGKKRGNNVDFGDIDFDSGFDIPGFDDSFDLKDNRSPIGHFKASLTGGLADKLKDRNFFKRIIGIALPKGYSQLDNAYDGVRRGISDIYRDNQADLQPHLMRAGRMLERNTPRIFNTLPRGMKALFKDAGKAHDFGGSGQGSSDLDQQLSSLEAFFQQKGKIDIVKDAQDDILKKRRFELQMQGSEIQTNLLNRLVSYQDTITIGYQRKSLELGYRQYDVTARTLMESREYHKKTLEFLGAIGKNTALPDFVKMNTEEALKDSMRRRLMEATTGGLSGWVSGYGKNLQKKISSTLGGAMSGMSMASEMGGAVGLSKGGMAGMAAGSMVSEFAASKAAPLIEYLVSLAAPTIEKTPGIRTGGNFLREWLTAPAQRANRWAKSTTTQDGALGSAIDMLKNFVDQYDPASKIHGGGVEQLGDVAKFDKLFHTTVTEIMPAYMASMDKSLRELVTGQAQEENAYSHYTGGMVSRSTLNAQNVRIGLKQSQGDNVRREVDSILVSMKADELSPEAKRALRRRLLRDLQSGNNFEPSDYIKADSWPEVDDSVGDELTEFFADTFRLDMEGKFTGNQKDRTFNQDVNQVFTDVSKRLPNLRQRMDVLSGTIGRRTWRELGMTRYDGVNSDTINADVFNDYLLGQGDSDLQRGPNRKLDDFDLKDLVGSTKRRNQQKKDFAEASKREEEELKRLNEQFGEDEFIDSTSGGSGVVNTLARRNLQNDSESEPTGKVGRMNFKLRDAGTHQRLDRIIGILQTGGSRQAIGSAAAEVSGANPIIDDLVSRAAGHLSKGITKGRKAAGDAYAQAENYLKTNPRVRKGLAHIERIHGKITDPELRASIIQAIYSRTGTPEEIASKLKTKMDELKSVLSAKRDQAGDWIKDKTSPANRERYREELLSQIDAVRERASGFADSSKAWAKDATSKASRDKYKQQAQDLAERILSFTGKHFNSHRGANGSGEAIVDGMSVTDIGLNEKMLQLIDIQMQHGDLLVSIASGTGNEGSTGDTPQGARRHWFREMSSSLLGKGRSLASGLFRAGSGYAKMWGGIYGGAAKMLGGGVAGIGRAISGSFRKDAVGDVFVQGSEDPILTAKGIRGGWYRDVTSGEIITSLADISGPVVDVRSDETVLTADDFAKGLYDIKGQSLASKLSGLIGRGVGRASRLVGSYVGNTYGLMFKGMRGATGILADQLTQFDAYFPGEDTPRIRSKLMKEGFYRDEAGEVIDSLADIKGPVYDKDGNLIISQDEINTHKRLYARNGSLLFTFGRGVVTLGKFAVGLAVKAATAYGKAVWGATKWVGRKLKGIGSMFSRRGGGKVDAKNLGSLEEIMRATFEVNMAQLETQRDILDVLKGPDSDWRDKDGDGVRENSWADRLRKRAGLGGAAAGGSAEVVEAIERLGIQLEDNLKDLGEQVEDSGGGGDTNIGWMGGIKDFFGGRRKGRLGKLGGKLGRAGSWIGRGGRAAVGMLGMGGLMSGAGGMLASAGGAIMTGLGVAGSALAGVISAPVLIGAAVLGGLAYVGYKAYKNAQFKDKPLYHLRMAQYGVSPSDGERVDLILALEALVKPGIVTTGDSLPQLDPNKFDVAKVEGLFGIQPKGQNEDEANEDRRKKLYAWVAYRFKPTYLAHCKMMMELANTVDLSQEDERVQGKMLEKALNTVLLPGLTQMYDKLDLSPFDGKLSEDKGDVDNYVEKIRDLAAKAPTNKDPSTALKGGVLTDSAKAATVLTPSITGGSDVEKIKEELTRNARTVNDARRGAQNRFTNQDSYSSNRRALNLNNAVRYLTYGITEFTLDKVDDLYRVENLFWEKVEFDSTISVMLTGDMKEHIASVQAIFKAVTVEQKAQVELWFQHRFLPAFYQYLLGVRRNFNGSLKDAEGKLSNESLRSVLRAMSEVTTRMDNQSKDIWSVPFSPWPGYVLGSDPSVITKYLSSIPTSSPGPLTVDGLDRANDTGTTRDGDYQKFLMGKATSSKTDNLGRQTNTGSILNNMRTSYEGIGRTGAGLLTQGAGAASPSGTMVPHPGGGSGGDINALPESRGNGAAANRDLIHAAAKMVGFDPDIAMTVCGVESNWRPGAGAGSSTAKGLFQFIGTTWREMLDKYGKKFGINPNTSPMDPKANAILGVQYLKDNYASIKRNNPDAKITDQTLYMAHFLGPGGAGKWLRQAPGTPSSQATWDLGQYRANPGVFTEKGRELTVGEVNAKLAGRLAAMRKLAGSSSTTAGGNPEGDGGTDSPAVDKVTLPEDQTDAGMGTLGIMPMKPGGDVTSPSNADSSVFQPDAPSAPPLPRAPSTSASLAADNAQSNSERSASELGSLSSILNQQLQSLRNIDANTKAIHDTLLRQPQAVNSNQSTARQAQPVAQPLPQQVGRVNPAPRLTTSNARVGAI